MKVMTMKILIRCKSIIKELINLSTEPVVIEPISFYKNPQ